MIRTVIMLLFWALLLPPVLLIALPGIFLTGDIALLYKLGMWGAITGVRLAGVKVRTEGLQRLDPKRNYIYLSNHVSNIDPPLMLPLIPGRTSVMAKKELFDLPLLGKVMRLGSLVPVDRKNRKGGMAALRAASEVIRNGLSMMIYVEGGRSFDGKLLPFKKGPFYIAEDCQVPVVPVTILGTHAIMPKGRFAIHSGTATVVFHDPIEPADFGSREMLMARVRAVINSSLPPTMQEQAA
ncbi:MAG: 1-acyl-sn-glycerol-3-phosphate acyltransferase [Acidobacteriales bacterium]|nr:1-acyl-sn-glycerol-3-phosphate acyltransferase [Terriglobales bacterium]